MAIVQRRRVIRIGGSKGLTFPARWTALLEKELEVGVDRVGIVIPLDLPLEEVEADVRKILAEIRKLRMRNQSATVTSKP